MEDDGANGGQGSMVTFGPADGAGVLALSLSRPKPPSAAHSSFWDTEQFYLRHHDYLRQINIRVRDGACLSIQRLFEPISQDIRSLLVRKSILCQTIGSSLHTIFIVFYNRRDLHR
jgi:hypothetical protein